MSFWHIRRDLFATSEGGRSPDSDALPLPEEKPVAMRHSQPIQVDGVFLGVAFPFLREKVAAPWPFGRQAFLRTRCATCQIRVISPAASATPICAGVPINNAPPG